MDRVSIKRKRRARRKTGIRKRIIGTPDRPRLTVYRSLRHMYAQVVDDLAGKTLVSASTVEPGFSLESGPGNVDAAKHVGAQIAQKAKAAGINSVVLDRNGFRFHGRVKALADAAREGGLEF